MKLLILGATGTIGQKTINLISKLNDIELVGFSFYKNINIARDIKEKFPNSKIYSPINDEINNTNSYQELISTSKPDLVLNSIIGFDGLELTLLSIRNKLDIALANKESIVMGGDLLLNEAKKNNVSIVPIDSEHTALWSLIKTQNKEIDKLYITASGGKYYNCDIDCDYKFEDVIKHPIWNMGEKISIDSSTMINKFFEIIEAYYYFKIDKIEALYHPEVLVHAMIKFKDGSYISNLYEPDMAWSIQQALTSFNSNDKIIKDMDIYTTYHFEKIDEEKWKPIKWANDFLRTKNNLIPIIVNISNDIIFDLFKNKKTTFNKIIPIIETCLFLFKDEKINKIEDIYILNDKIKKYILGNINEF